MDSNKKIILVAIAPFFLSVISFLLGSLIKAMQSQSPPEDRTQESLSENFIAYPAELALLSGGILPEIISSSDSALITASCFLYFVYLIVMFLLTSKCSAMWKKGASLEKPEKIKAQVKALKTNAYFTAIAMTINVVLCWIMSSVGK